MCQTVLELVPGRVRLRVLLLRFEPEDRLPGKPGRGGRLVRLSCRSSSSVSVTSRTLELLVWEISDVSGIVGSDISRAGVCSFSPAAARLTRSSSDQTDETRDRCGFQRPEAGPGVKSRTGVKSRSEDTDVSARELDDGARIRGYWMGIPLSMAAAISGTERKLRDEEPGERDRLADGRLGLDRNEATERNGGLEWNDDGERVLNCSDEPVE